MTANWMKVATTAPRASPREEEINSKLLRYKYSLEHLPVGNISNEYKILMDEDVQHNLLRYKAFYPSLNSNQLLLNDLEEYLTKRGISYIQPATTEKEIEIHNKRIKYITEQNIINTEANLKEAQNVIRDKIDHDFILKKIKIEENGITKINDDIRKHISDYTDEQLKKRYGTRVETGGIRRVMIDKFTQIANDEIHRFKKERLHKL